MNNSKKPLARNEGLIIQELPDEVLVYDSANDKAHCLNQTAALIWQHCDGKTQIADIAKIIEKKLGAPVKEEFVWLALDQLEKESLLEKDAEFSLKSLGISRREVIKRVGLASVIALPIVASLLNPMSVKAGTCNQACNAATPCLACGGTAPLRCDLLGVGTATDICLATCVSGTMTCQAG